MQKREAPSSPRIVELKKRKRKILKVKIIFFSFLFLLVLTGISFLSRWQEININEIVIIGNKIVDTTVIEKVVNEELDGHYAWILPKRNSLLFPKAAIQERLETDFKRFQSVELELKELKTLEITVTERKAVYTWCGESVVVSIDTMLEGEIPEQNKCYFMNESGYVFDEAPYFSGDVYFKFFGRIDNVNRDGKGPVGLSFLPETFNKVVFFLDTVKAMDIRPSSLQVLEDGDVELYLKANTLPPESPKVVFKIGSDLVKVAENLQASIQTDPLKSGLRTKYETLQYIDLRFGNKVYYKFK